MAVVNRITIGVIVHSLVCQDFMFQTTQQSRLGHSDKDTWHSKAEEFSSVQPLLVQGVAVVSRGLPLRVMAC